MYYPVNEIFQTLQGEATFTGTPSVFVRLQGCPVGCGWCDTKYTWEVSGEHSQLTANQLLSEVQKFAARHVVITGGEPCMYDLDPLIDLLLSYGYQVQIETSGVFPITENPDVWVTVSPKINMPGGTCKDDSILRANEIKMPVGKQRDIENILRLAIPKDKPVWLQPLSESPTATRLCIEAATQYQWRVSFQIHKLVGLP